MDIDTSFPPWLAARNAPQAQSPWLLQALQQGMEREKMRQTLPLEIQGLALQNKAHALELERQGIANNLADEEMRAYTADLPLLAQALRSAQATPGGAIGMGTPAFQSKKALGLWQERQKADAATAYGQAVHQATIDQVKAATEAMRLTGKVIRPGPNGMFDPQELATLLSEGEVIKRQNETKAAAAKDPLSLHLNTIMDATDEYNRALETGNEADVTRAKLRLETAQGLALPTNETIETTYDEQGRASVKITRGKMGAATPAAGSLTPANLTKAQESQAQALTTIDVANRLEPLLDRETTGVQAFAESWIKDRVLAQWAPELASDKRAKAETLAARLRASAVKELRSDGNISEPERKQILQAVPSINDPVNSPPRARRLVREVRTMSAIHALVKAKNMGTPVPRPAALALDDEELGTLVDQGMITPEMAVQAYDMKHPK